MAPTLMPLAEAPRRAGERVNFTAVVQQISGGRRALVSAGQRVAPYRELLLADATQQLFKLICWGETLPTLPAADHAPADATLRVGDIALFSNCSLKSFRGRVEAQFSPSQSMVQLLYRRDRYFNTRDVRLTDLYPMIEWYREHRELFLLSPEAVDGSGASLSPPVATRIRDLRENMVATVVCRLRPAPEPMQSSRTGRSPGSSELDGVLLRELVMADGAGPSDAMAVNLWDQHAEHRAVARLLRHRGAVRVCSVVVGLEAMSNRLLATTTDQTTFACLPTDDLDAIALAQRLGASSGMPKPPPIACATIQDLEKSTAEGYHVLSNARVEQLHFDQRVDLDGCVLPRWTHRLVEAYCRVCELALPGSNTSDEHDGRPLASIRECPNKCKPRSNGEPLFGWRYRVFRMTLRDECDHRLVVEVSDAATAELVGNVDAQSLASSDDQRSAAFDARSMVATMLNALVVGDSQLFQAEIRCVHGEGTSHGYSQADNDPSQATQCERRLYVLSELAPCIDEMLPF